MKRCQTNDEIRGSIGRGNQFSLALERKERIARRGLVPHSLSLNAISLTSRKYTFRA